MKKILFVMFVLLTTALSANAVEEAIYYLTGLNGSWQINETYQLTRNTEAEAGIDEFMITLDLKTTDMFKIAKSTDGTNISKWYPDGMENAYGEHGEITKNAKYTVYFRPAGYSDPAWFNGLIYVEEAKNTALDVVVGSNPNSVKIMQNGKVFILRNGIRYNANGAAVK